MPRPRKPTALKIAEGDQPCRINGSEPTSPDGLGEPPRHIVEDPDALAAWIRIEATLEDLGLIKRADAEAVMLYCETWSLYMKACAEIEDAGLTVATKTTMKANPALAIRSACLGQLQRFLTEFGMTPASRAGLHVDKGPEDDPFSEWMKAGKTAPNAKDTQAGQGPRQGDRDPE